VVEEHWYFAETMKNYTIQTAGKKKEELWGKEENLYIKKFSCMFKVIL